MQVRPLKIVGAYEFTPQIFADDRGSVTSPYREDVFREAIGRPLFPVALASYSVSRRGAVRGIHFTDVPPGMGKYAYCVHGRAVEYLVDTRLGSPTFGTWDSVELDPATHRSVYLPIGVGNLFASLEDETVIAYLLSADFLPERERAIHPMDPDLALPFPEDLEVRLSARDAAAPTLAEARARGLLPDYARCRELDESSVGTIAMAAG